ncbi:MAG: roadblock/LC7 domain-containing protein [Rhodospirillales bacterium]
MSAVNLIIEADDLSAIEKNLKQLCEDANASFAFLIDLAGQQLASIGASETIDMTSLASLTAGNVAATEGLAQIIGEPGFSSLFHEGEHDSLLITTINGRVILVIAFDERSSLGLVRLRVRQASQPLGQIVGDIERRSAAQSSQMASDSPFGEITDEDIDGLFAE